MSGPARGEVWLANLDPTRGREQAGQRPILVISQDVFNQGPADLVIVAPMTTRARGIPYHVPVVAPEGGVRAPCFVMCEAVRSIAKERLILRWGQIAGPTMARVEDRLRILLGL